jgi:SAM-dependent methyltransferase
MDDANVNLWGSPAHALEYLARADAMPHRCEGEGELLEWLPRPLVRVLDLGSGDGRLLALIKLARPDGEAVALDFSATMIDRLQERFTADSSVRIVEHDLNSPLPASLGAFDAVVSSLAIHHLPHARKRTLFAEVYRLLAPSGVFCNLEHVASPTARLHQRYLATLGRVEDPSNKLLDLETQLAWLRAIGFVDVDCHWKWRELALLVGSKADPA